MRCVITSDNVWRLTAQPHLDERWPADVDSVAGIRSAVRGFARAAGADRELIDDVALAITEAATNAVIHARAQTVVVVGIVHDHSISFDVVDDGAGIGPDPANQGLGLGLSIIVRLADDVNIHDAPAGGTRVAMRFGMSRPRHPG